MSHGTSIFPDIKFGLFFNEIYPAMMNYKRRNIPELSDENPLEPGNQLIRMMAAATHYSNTLTDVVASELFLSTAQKQDSVREHTRNMGYEMSPGKPASVDIIARLSQSFVSVPKTLISKYSRFLANSDNGTVSYLAKSDFVLNYANDNVSDVVVYEALNASPWQDITADAKSTVTPGDDVQPFTSLNKAGDCIYFGHKDLMFDSIKLYFTTENLNIQGVWEYYDGEFDKSYPDYVEIKTQNIKLVINNYLGNTNRQGTKIRIKCLINNSEQIVYSYWDGSNNIVETSSYLLQSDPSTDVSDYIIGSDWEELDLTTTSVFGQDDIEIKYNLPQSEEAIWNKTEIYDGSSECYWIRFRLVESINGSLPVMQYVEFTQNTKNYIIFSARQGVRQTDILGSSNGSPLQRFKATKEYFIDDNDFTVTVDLVEWTRVYDFISSNSNDKHYVIELDKNDVPVIVFGDGNNGAIPNAGNLNVIFTYNYDVKENGNIGARTINSSAGGITFVDQVYNPRSASGWSQSEGSTKESLRLAKINASKQQRIVEVALNSDDVVTMASRFSNENNESLFSRVFCFSDIDSAAYGPKTMKLVVVMRGGGLATQEQLDEYALYFNGNKFSNPIAKSRIVSGHKLFAVNHSPKKINIRVNVNGSNINSEEIKTTLIQLLNPEAVNEDGDYIWTAGESISISKLSHIIHNISKNIKSVTFIEPTESITMNSHELPTPGTISVKIGS